jgi:hypothetical protein
MAELMPSLFHDSSSSEATMKLHSMTRRAALGTVGALVFSAAIPSIAGALPATGAARAPLTLVDGWDREIDLAKFERSILLIYEDKDSANQNQALKDQLAALDKSIAYEKYVAHISVADVSAYDYWPAKGIAKGELRKWSQKLGLVIYGDFSGDARGKLALDKGASNVVLYAKSGEVLFAASGALSTRQRDALVDLLRGLCVAA